MPAYPHSQRSTGGISALVPATLGFVNLESLAPRERVFHQGAQQESYSSSSFVCCLVTSGSSCQEISSHRKKSLALGGN